MPWDDHPQAKFAKLRDCLGDDVVIRIDEVQPADQRVQGDIVKDLPGMATDVDHASMGATCEDCDPLPLNMGGHETLVHDPRIRFPVPVSGSLEMGLEPALKAAAGDLTTEIKQPVQDLLRLCGDHHVRAMLFEYVSWRHVLERKEFATGQPHAPFDESSGMHMQRNRLTAIRSANQLEGFDQPLRMVEMTVRQHQGLDPPEIEVHVPAIALQSIRVRARIEEHGAGFTVPMRRDRQAQPMVGRTERLAGEFGHPRGHEDAQLGSDVLGTSGQHVCDVIHHNVDSQLVYCLHISQPFIMIKGNPGRRGPVGR